MIKIYFSQPLNTSSNLHKLPLVLQQHIAKRKQKHKQLLSLTGYWMLQQVLEKDFGTTLESLVFLDSGKPILKGYDIYFSISHSKNLVGLVISTSGNIGLDIEPFRKFEKVASAFSFFSKAEQDFILASPQPERSLIELWSKKEALIKALGSQMFDDASKTDVRFSTGTCTGQHFFFKSILVGAQYDFDGEIWVAASFPIDKVHIDAFFSL